MPPPQYNSLILEKAAMIQRIIKNYGVFLAQTSDLFAQAARKHNVKCRRGCFECCASGFFDISLLDALYLRASLRHLSPPVRERITARAEEQLDILEKKQAFSRRGPLLKSLSEIDTVSRRSVRMSCPALENGACMIYHHRPHICRIFGPTVRGPRRAVRLEGCGYFSRDIPETDFPILSNYADEEVLLRALFKAAGRTRIREVDTIIPAALTLDMKKWL